MKPFFFFFLLFVTHIYLAYAQQEPPRKILLKVNLGGLPVADFLSDDQVLETEGLHKTTSKEKIANTDQQEVFQTQRFARDEDFVMRIPVPDGVYSLTLLFAETYKKACVPGGRVFDISLGTPISGVTKIFEDFDVFQAAGCASAHGRRFDKIPSKGGIVIQLTKKKQHPSLAGFIIDGYPVPKGDGSEYRAVGHVQSEGGAETSTDSSGTEMAPFAGAPTAASAGAPPAVGEPLDRAPPGGPLEAVHPAGVPGEAMGNEQMAPGMQPGGSGPVMADGQQAMNMAPQPQMPGQATDAGQMPGNPEMMQQTGVAGGMGAQPHY